MAEFQVGEKAVYPGYGVAEITKIENREISGSQQRFYVLRVLGKEMTLMVPMSNADSVGLRNIIGAVEVEQVYDVLRKRGEKISTATWNRRYREYMEKIRTGSLTEIATVLRDLCLLRSDKDLSYGERNMLETARALLVQELALAKGQGEETVEAEIEGLVSLTHSCGARWPVFTSSSAPSSVHRVCARPGGLRIQVPRGYSPSSSRSAPREHELFFTADVIVRVDAAVGREANQRDVLALERVQRESLATPARRLARTTLQYRRPRGSGRARRIDAA